jgi:hypothetical protein
MRYAILLLLFPALCACSATPKKPERTTPLPAHLTDAAGSPVQGAPEPEVVQLKSVEMIDGMLHVTVSNVAGDYTLVCNPSVNKDSGPASCLAPRPQQEYLLFRKETRWLVNGAKEPLTLAAMEDFTVTYNDKENIMLYPAKNEGESPRIFWLLSWRAR